MIEPIPEPDIEKLIGFRDAENAELNRLITVNDLRDEWRYRYQERLGIMCGDGEASEEQKKIAQSEADAAIIELSKAC